MKDTVNFDVINGVIYVNWRYGYKVNIDGDDKYIPLKFSTGERASKKHWNKSEKRLSSGNDKKKINQKLDEWEKQILKAIEANKAKGVLPSPDEILSQIKPKQGVSTKTELSSYIHNKLDRDALIRDTTKKQYRYFADKIERYQSLIDNVYIEDLDDVIVAKILYWIQFESVAPETLKDSTMSKYKKNFKVFLRHAINDGIPFKISLESKVLARKRYYADHVSLSRSRLLELASFQLAPEKEYLQTALDLFVVSCFTGLRISDWGRMGKIHETKSGEDSFYSIQVRMQKTDALVSIPIQDVVLSIYRRYDNKFPKPMIEQTFNRYIKEIGELLGWVEPISKRDFIGGKIIYQDVRFCDMLSSHTGRRTFCTLSLSAGIPVDIIMKISGHKDNKSFFTYISSRNDMALLEHYKTMKSFFNF